MNASFGGSLRQEMGEKNLISFIGVYDVFSASIAAQYYNGIATGARRRLQRKFNYIGQTNFPLTVVCYVEQELLIQIEYDRSASKIPG